MYSLTVNLVLQVVRLDVGPKGMDDACSTFFFDAKNVPCKVKTLRSWSVRRLPMSHQALVALETARGIVVGVG